MGSQCNRNTNHVKSDVSSSCVPEWLHRDDYVNVIKLLKRVSGSCLLLGHRAIEHKAIGYRYQNIKIYRLNISIKTEPGKY